jgi:hypothetical protein
MSHRLLAAATALALAGCGGSDEPETVARTAPRPSPTGDEAVIRGWISALNSGNYGRAASYFVPRALIEQGGVTVRLEDLEAAEDFNRSLPCQADLTDTKDEGATTLGAFRLRGRRCDAPGGGARVRFRIRAGKIAEWRQLPEPAGADGEIA